MMYLRRITGRSRHYLVCLPRRVCKRDGIGPGSVVGIQVRIDDALTEWPARVVAGGRGLHVTIPRAWRISEGLTAGDPVLLLERAPGSFALRIVEGASEKELHRRMEIVMRLRIEKARAEVEAARGAGERHGRSLGYCQALGEFSRRRECFNPEHSRGKDSEGSG